ncbi:MAG: NERD domain-containing protein [Limnochordia bacterium]|nr:NERD domain-containing protein [Limnochordia bacterium]MDD2629856.1 NERD domain-containing protein [Limnochordia bacterium]
MSKMIPPYYEHDTTSNAEKQVFCALQNLTDDYVVLHSLGLANHRDKVFGEIDFVVICSEGVLCLEVKGGGVSRRSGIWYFQDRFGNEHANSEGPFQQVIGSMHSLRRHLEQQFGKMSPIGRCLYAVGVLFPDTVFTAKGPDIIDEIVFDLRDDPDEIELYIKKVFRYWQEDLRNKHGFTGGRLNPGEVSCLTEYLRGDFGFVPSLGHIVSKTEKQLLALTKEQAERLSMAEDSRRILLSGGAGTGKTLLSLEYARRKVLTGHRVLYLCYNQNLSKYLQHKAVDLLDQYPQRFRIDTFHNYIMTSLEKVGCAPDQSTPSPDVYFNELVPEGFLAMGSHGIYHDHYDLVVVDEGQDLFRTEFILCLDQILKDGLTRGTWHMCYDPNQNLYNPHLEEGLQLIQEAQPTLLSLDTNCRNTKEIGDCNAEVTGIPPAKYLKVQGEKVRARMYEDKGEQRTLVVKAVKDLLHEGTDPGKILLLSRYRYENSCLQGTNVFQGICRFQDITGIDFKLLVEDSVKFCTIHSFKGLEAPVVLLLDVEAFDDNYHRHLNYTAISRATSLLYVFYHRSLHKRWQQIKPV